VHPRTGTVAAAPASRPAGKPPRGLRRLDQAEAYVAGICFKTGPPRLLGVELEWTVHHDDDPRRPLDPALLARALHPHSPSTLDPESDHRPLPGGNLLTVEPGGQVEISSQPHASLTALHAAVDADVRYLTDLLSRDELRLGGYGADAHRPPRRLLHTPRYDAMARAFAPYGAHGATMMCGTAAVQVSLDAGEPPRVAARWAALHALGPTLLALFANSGRYAGHPTGWASSRMRAWLSLDPARTGPVPDDGDPAEAYARYALRAPVLCVPGPGNAWLYPGQVSFADWIGGALGSHPTVEDLDYHLTTLFPPVRPRGYLEVRYLDQQPPGQWPVPLAVLVALLADDRTIDAVRDVCAPTRDRWLDAARLGLADTRLAATARAVVDLATERLAATGLSPGMTATVVEALQGNLVREGTR